SDCAPSDGAASAATIAAASAPATWRDARAAGVNTFRLNMTGNREVWCESWCDMDMCECPTRTAPQEAPCSPAPSLTPSAVSRDRLATSWLEAHLPVPERATPRRSPWR